MTTSASATSLKPRSPVSHKGNIYSPSAVKIAALDLFAVEAGPLQVISRLFVRDLVL